MASGTGMTCISASVELAADAVGSASGGTIKSASAGGVGTAVGGRTGVGGTRAVRGAGVGSGVSEVGVGWGVVSRG